MKAGKLRKRLSFQAQSAEKNSFGEQLGWTTYYSCWGGIEVLKGQLAFQTQQFIQQNTYSITIRHTTEVTISPAHRILCDGRVYEIQAVLNKEMRNRELQILAYVLNGTE